jgi:siroheme synthase-like protein
VGYYPVFIDMTGRRALVIGGGLVAEDKVRGLLAAAADVTVVSPDLTKRLASLHDEGRLRWQQRPYSPGDLAGFELCMIATDDGAVNAAVAAEGKQAGVWVNARQPGAGAPPA